MRLRFSIVRNKLSLDNFADHCFIWTGTSWEVASLRVLLIVWDCAVLDPEANYPLWLRSRIRKRPEAIQHFIPQRTYLSLLYGVAWKITLRRQRKARSTRFNFHSLIVAQPTEGRSVGPGVGAETGRRANGILTRKVGL